MKANIFINFSHSSHFRKKMQKLRELELSGCVFKRCITATSDYLVALKKPTENFQCNELRRAVINKNFAKFRCNGLITVAIYSIFDHKFIDHFVNVVLQTYTEYRVGSVVFPDRYDEDIDSVCTNGIHYFLTLNSALLYKNGEVNGYDCNGQPVKKLKKFKKNTYTF